MKNVGLTIKAVLMGAVLWAGLWTGGMATATALFPNLVPKGQPVTHTGVLLGLIIYSLPLSMLAGLVTAVMAVGDRMRTVWILATLQLALGLYFETSSWNLAPVWYHLVFLALVVPATLYGGAFVVRHGKSQAAYTT